MIKYPFIAGETKNLFNLSPFDDLKASNNPLGFKKKKKKEVEKEGEGEQKTDS